MVSNSTKAPPVKTLSSGYKIPPKPQILTDIQNACPNLEKVSELISQDIALSADVLKTVNSPIYGLATNVVSIKKAVVILGIDAVLNIVNGELLRRTMSESVSKNASFKLFLEDFWQGALDVALTSVAVVQSLGFGSPDEAYTLGLFHNCGIPIILFKYNDYFKYIHESYACRGVDLTSIENQHFKTNHAVVGYLVAKQWGLPQSVRDAIRDHHNLDRLSFKYLSERSEVDIMMAVLKMAEHMCRLHLTLGKETEDHEWQHIKVGVLDFLGLSEPDYEDLKGSVLDKIAATVGL